MEETYGIKKIIISLFIVVLVIIVFYGITILVTKNKKNEEVKPTEDVQIQYDEILAGEIFTQKEDEYYVLAYDNGGQDYISKLKSYSSLENSIKAYTVDLNSAFNKNYYVPETSVIEKTHITFSETTLLKVSNKNIIETYTGDDITAKFDELTKVEE